MPSVLQAYRPGDLQKYPYFPKLPARVQCYKVELLASCVALVAVRSIGYMLLLLCNVKIQSCGKNRIYSISGWKYYAKHSAATLGLWRNAWKVSWGRLFAVAKFNLTVFRSLCAIVLCLRCPYLCPGPTVKSFKMVLKWQKSRYVSTLVQCFEDFPYFTCKKIRNKFVLDSRSRKAPLEKSVTWHALT